MDKRPVYPGAIPTDTDLLQPQRNVEIALGFIMQAAFGTGTVIDGLAVAQQASPNMTVQVAPGSIIFATTVDTLTSGFGSLTLDNSDPLVKIGINLLSTNMSALTAPVTTGQSQNWLVEAQFAETDGSAAVLNYYNSTNPNIPYTGPGNAGTTNNTARTNTVSLQWKAGTAATTGTQTTPAPDAGWVGVAVVTVAHGQTSIVNANISAYVNSPIVPFKLGSGIVPGLVGGGTRGLKITVTGNAAATVSAASVSVSNSAGACLTVNSLASTLNAGANGLNGLYTGSIAANTWYNVWAVANRSVSGCVLSLSSSVPDASITSAFPYYTRLGAVRTNGSSNLLGTLQVGKQARYVVGGPNVSGLPQMLTGGFGNVSTPTWVAVPVAVYVPPTAVSVLVGTFSTNITTSNEAIIAPNSSYGPLLSSSNPPLIASAFGAGSPIPLLLESVNIFAATQINCGLICYGWEDVT